ncbi:transposable element Tcb1 transposase [Trichonephila clavipes]|nr:transposable element Tcb1 transposase [Trichonephila clavipes]
MFSLRYQETNSIRNIAGKYGKKRHTTFVDDRKIERLSERRMSPTAIKSGLNDAGVSVSSRIIRRRLTDVRLKGRHSPLGVDIDNPENHCSR